jgi:hypothetical protein
MVGWDCLLISPELVEATSCSTPRNEMAMAEGVLCEYVGDVLTADEIDARYITENEKNRTDSANYAFQVSRDRYIDPIYSNQGPGRYANDCRKSKYACNAKFSLNSRTKRVFIKAVKQIKQGDEILISYGAGYWARAKGNSGLKKHRDV